MNAAVWETVDDDDFAPSLVLKWLALDTTQVSEQSGEALFRLGVPCRRKEIRPARTRYTYKNGGVAGDSDAGWDDHFNAGIVLEEIPQDEEMHREVVIPASYFYETAEVFAHLPARAAHWCYMNFEADELIAMFKLHGAHGWYDYVQEMREQRDGTVSE